MINIQFPEVVRTHKKVFALLLVFLLIASGSVTAAIIHYYGNSNKPTDTPSKQAGKQDTPSKNDSQTSGKAVTPEAKQPDATQPKKPQADSGKTNTTPKPSSGSKSSGNTGGGSTGGGSTGGGTPTPPHTPSPLFVGNFETGNFNQWSTCQFKGFNSSCSSYNNSLYSLQAQTSVVRQGNYAARFEVRDGDVPPFGGGERSEVQGSSSYEGGEGAERWYQWSTMFAPGFPATGGWEVFSQWHAFSSTASPPIAFMHTPWSMSSGNWGLDIHTYDGNGNVLGDYVPWQAPLATGTWHDIKMHIKWSSSDAIGYIELWRNGVRQTFTAAPCAGQTTCHVRTMIPNDGGVYFKQGYYRDPAMTATGIIYHDGFSIATTEADLAPL